MLPRHHVRAAAHKEETVARHQAHVQALWSREATRRETEAVRPVSKLYMSIFSQEYIMHQNGALDVLNHVSCRHWHRHAGYTTPVYIYIYKIIYYCF